ncbi:hypothetical protein NE237_023799 [Protea cynaroides]|uniref:Uncharacterized protein n=1 Tax=Protea cynaroides TaxID=273540 RepID=A0A9Q0K6E4_9MAGN|nr:hypothetical protein NE237_023799 [Protea cynaroides]
MLKDGLDIWVDVKRRYFISCSCRAIEVVALVGHLLILDLVISSFLNFIFAETLDQVEELKPVKAVEHETSTRIPHALDSETAKPLETSDQMKGLEMVKPLEYETSIHIPNNLWFLRSKPSFNISSGIRISI